MKTWIRRSLLGLSAAAIAFGGIAACGHRYGEHAGWERSAEDRARTRAKIMDRVTGRLELDAAQKQKLAVLADKVEAQRAVVMGQAKPRDVMRTLVAGEKFDRAKAQAFVAEKTAAVQVASPEVITALADFYDSLKPAQQAQVREFMDKRGGHGWRR